MKEADFFCSVLNLQDHICKNAVLDSQVEERYCQTGVSPGEGHHES